MKDSFENGFVHFDGIPELEVPQGWTPYWTQGNETGKLVRPEFKPKYNTVEVMDGEYSASIHTRFATHRGGLYRVFPVKQGLTYVASVWAMIVDGESGKSGHGLRLGLDPSGAASPSDKAAWSDWYSQYMTTYKSGRWTHLTATTIAQSSSITVFLHSQNDYPRDAFGHFDLFELEALSDNPISELNEAQVRKIVREELKAIFSSLA